MTEIIEKATEVAARSTRRVDRQRDVLFYEHLICCGMLAHSVKQAIAGDGFIGPAQREALADYTQSLRTLSRYDMSRDAALAKEAT